MKLLLSALALISFNSFGGSVFVETSEWSGPDAQSVVEMQGIRMNAIQDALNSCKEAGATFCALKSVENSTYNVKKYSNKHSSYRRFSSATAVIQSLDDKSLTQNGIYQSKDTWNFDSEPSVLESEGVRAESLEDAISQCHKAGNDFCVIESITFSANNSPYYDTTYSRMRRKTSAAAIVKGFISK